MKRIYNIKSIAKIAKGTKRKKREINLLELAQELKSLYNKKKSLKEVASIVKLSPEMIREFLKVTELDVAVKKLIKTNLIKGVDTAYRISMLPRKEQLILAKQIINRTLLSSDVRAIIRYKMDNPRITIEKATNDVIQSKTKKIYIAYFGIEKDTFDKLIEKRKDNNKIIRSIFNRTLPARSIVDFEINGRVVIIKVTREGLTEMRNKAKRIKIPLAKLADALIKQYLKGAI